MKITIFSSNQPRHLSFVKALGEASDEVFFINEVNSVFPGTANDKNGVSQIKENYFSKVRASEKNIFGDISFLSSNIRTLNVKAGDLSKLNSSQLMDALKSEIYIVFGASYIKGWLADFLVDQRAINIHMGLSPFYRGTACNFWALYDNNPGYVGATIHYLSKGLDNGDIIFHCVPEFHAHDTPFDFSMRAVSAAHKCLLTSLDKKMIFSLPSVKQDKSLEIRYSKHQDFTDIIVKDYFDRKNDLSDSQIIRPKLLNLIFE